MTKSIVAVTALAGSLLLVPVGPASAGALDGMKGLAAPQAGTVHLVGHGGGGVVDSPVAAATMLAVASAAAAAAVRR